MEINPSQIVDQDGSYLYPAYFNTHLKIPPNCLLPGFKLWDIIDVGVNVSKYGEMILSSDYIIGHSGSTTDNPENWDGFLWPAMKGNNLITIDNFDRRHIDLNISKGKYNC